MERWIISFEKLGGLMVKKNFLDCPKWNNTLLIEILLLSHLFVGNTLCKC